MATIQWAGGTHNWSDTAAWVGGVVPTSADDVRFSTNTTGTLTITNTSASPAQCKSLVFTSFTGTLTMGSTAYIQIGSTDGTSGDGTCTFGSGMTFTPNVAATIQFMSAFQGTISIASGSKTLPALIFDGYSGGTATTYSFSAATTIGGVTTMGQNASNCVLTCSSTNALTFATFNLYGGTVTMNAAWASFSGTLAVNGGTWNQNAKALGATANGIIYLNGGQWNHSAAVKCTTFGTNSSSFGGCTIVPTGTQTWTCTAVTVTNGGSLSVPANSNITSSGACTVSTNGGFFSANTMSCTSLSSSTGGFQIAAGATWTLSSSVSITSNGYFDGSNGTITGATTVDISGTATANYLGAVSCSSTVTVAAGNCTAYGNITSSAGGLTVSSTGVLTLQPTISVSIAGTLTVSGTAQLIDNGVAISGITTGTLSSTLGQSSNHLTSQTFSGTCTVTGQFMMDTGSFVALTVSTGTLTICKSATATGNVTVGATGTLNYGPYGGSGGKWSAGTLTIMPLLSGDFSGGVQ